MKQLTKLTMIAATVAVFGTGAALADDQQQQNRLATQRQEMQRNQGSATVAVFANQQGVGRTDSSMQEQRGELRYEVRITAHGQFYGAYVAVD